MKNAVVKASVVRTSSPDEGLSSLLSIVNMNNFITKRTRVERRKTETLSAFLWRDIGDRMPISSY